MITTADLSYDGKQVVFALRRGGLVGSNPVAHIEDISRCADEKSNYHVFKINIDGTDHALFAGHQGRRIKHMACVTAGGLAVTA